MEVVDFNKIAAILSNMSCSIHGKPAVTIADGNTITVCKPCCEEFKEHIDTEFARQIERQIDETISSAVYEPK